MDENEFIDTLASFGFYRKSNSLFIANSHNNANKYLLYCVDSSVYRLVIETDACGVIDSKDIFRGFKIQTASDIKFLLGNNIFTSPLLKEKTFDECLS